LSSIATSEETSVSSGTFTTVSSSTTTTTTIAPYIVVPAQPFSADYEVNHTIYLSSSKSTSAASSSEVFEKLKVILAPEFYNLQDKGGTCSPTGLCIPYSLSYQGFGNPSQESIEKLIEIRANRSYSDGTKVSARKTRGN
jgi:hypothetical protein